MNIIHLSVHPAAGEAISAQLTPSPYTVGSGVDAQIQLPFEGVAERHVVLWVEENGAQVEPLVEGVQVNKHRITQRVEVAYPVYVQVAGSMLVLEVQPMDSDATVLVNPKEIKITIPPKETKPATKAMALPFPTAAQCAPTIVGDWSGPLPRAKSGTKKNTPESDDGKQRVGADKAPLMGEYTLVREIARGGMGKIYFGEDAQLKREVAVKVSSLACGGQDPRFSKEAEVLAKLSHPNIVPIYAVGTDGQGRPYYSMKLVKGRTLQAILDGLSEGDPEFVKNYPLPTLLTIYRKVCDAMAFAHSKGILHRDLKPENIMVGEYGEVLVMDWGLAKFLNDCGSDPVVADSVRDTGNYGMTIEGDVVGTPQYMSPEQAEGMVAELDERSDVYSLGGILYAILTLRAPIDGKTLDEVLTKVKSGQIRSMGTRRGGKERVKVGTPIAMDRHIPDALQAVTLKAMSLDRERRYEGVEAFSRDIEAYQNGFATQAEHAGATKRLVLFIKRNKVLAGSTAAMLVMMSGFSAKVMVEGRKASEALRELRASAPVFAARAEDALQEGNLEVALEAAATALRLDPEVEEYHRIRGNVLQTMVRWSEALKEYRQASGNELAQRNLVLTEQLIHQAETEGETKARARLFQELNAQGRQGEAAALVQKKEPSAIPELVRRLEEKLLPVPATNVLMSKTELTVGEWKLYLKAEGMPEWQQPTKDLKDWKQTDEHPVVNISWNEAMKFCEWLKKVTGNEWGLPTNAEWLAAVGNLEFPWGNHYPPNWDDGNYSVLADGGQDPKRVGVDSIRGTSPVASFKPNEAGFYDLGGNVWEWMSDGFERVEAGRSLRGAGWNDSSQVCRVSYRGYDPPDHASDSYGFRLVCRSGL